MDDPLCPNCLTTFSAPPPIRAALHCPECGHTWNPLAEALANALPAPPPPPLPANARREAPPRVAKAHREAPPRASSRRRQSVRVRGRWHFRCLACTHDFEKPLREIVEVTEKERADLSILQRLVRASTPPPPHIQCPKCGSPTPQQRGRQRQAFNLWLGLLPFLGLGFFVFLGLVLETNQGTIVVLLMAAVLALVQLLAAITAGGLYPVRIAELPEDDTKPTASYPQRKRTLGYGLLALAFVFLLAHPTRRALAPLPYNEGCSPSVVTSGEKVRVRVPNNLRSFGNHWNGTARVFVTNANDFKTPLKMTVTTKKEGVLNNIETPQGTVGNAPETYVDIVFHEHPELTMKPIELDIDLTVTYPQPVNNVTFNYVTTTVQKTVTVQVAERKQVRFDTTIGLFGGALGVLSSLLGLVWLAGSNKQLVGVRFPRRALIDEVK